MTVKVIKDSHLDHGLSQAQVAWVLEQIQDADKFGIRTLRLPDHLGKVPCSLHGPATGADPVPETDVRYARRGARPGDSRMCAREPVAVQEVTVIFGPTEGVEDMVLYTAFGGPLAPREPWDPAISSEEEKAASVAFWQTHALSA